METILLPVEEKARALWIQVQPTEDLMFMVGAMVAAIARNLSMTEIEVYERLVEEARKDPVSFTVP